jgi:DNA modification methylase
MGSGTTAIACEVLNRKWIGSELSHAYFKRAKTRIKNHVDIEWKAKLFFKY